MGVCLAREDGRERIMTCQISCHLHARTVTCRRCPRFFVDHRWPNFSQSFTNMPVAWMHQATM